MHMSHDDSTELHVKKCTFKKNTAALGLFLLDNNQLSANNSCAKSKNYCDVFPLCRSDLPSK